MNELFLDNKYTRVYLGLMLRAQTRTLETYSERHHVVPRCMGGSDAQENIVRLSAREHYLAHLLLCKMTRGANQRKMAFAFSRMNGISHTHQRHLPPSRWYEFSRKMLSEVQRNRQVSNDTRRLIGQIARNRSEESLEKMRLAKSKPCTVDGINIFPSKKMLGQTLGWGKTGTNSPNFKYV